MIHGLVVSFLVLSMLFATVHLFAVAASLYWYYWWLDIVMHTWGGVLIGFGLHAFSTFTCLPLRPTLVVLLLLLAFMTGLWEVFEWMNGLYNPANYLTDTAYDIICGFSGGLLAHLLLRRYTMKQL